MCLLKLDAHNLEAILLIPITFIVLFRPTLVHPSPHTVLGVISERLL
jgi:hypothetical protein